MSPLLVETLGFAGILALIYLFLILTDAEKRPSYFPALIRALPMGVLLVLALIIVNSMVEGRWDYRYIVDFILLKEVGGWVFRILTGLGYIFIVMGITSILAIGARKIIKK